VLTSTRKLLAAAAETARVQLNKGHSSASGRQLLLIDVEDLTFSGNLMPSHGQISLRRHDP